MVLRDSHCSVSYRTAAPVPQGHPAHTRALFPKTGRHPALFTRRHRWHYSSHVLQVARYGDYAMSQGNSSDVELLQRPTKGALAAVSQHITLARFDLGSGLRCIGPTSLWPARRTLWFTRRDMPVSSKNTPRREELMRAPEKDAHMFSWWLNNNQFSRLICRSPRWMFSLGWSLLKISWKSFTSGRVVYQASLNLCLPIISSTWHMHLCAISCMLHPLWLAKRLKLTAAHSLWTRLGHSPGLPTDSNNMCWKCKSIKTKKVIRTSLQGIC